MYIYVCMYVCMYMYQRQRNGTSLRVWLPTPSSATSLRSLACVSVCRVCEREHGVVCYLLKVSCLSLLTISQGSKQALLRLYAGSIKGCVCHGVVAVEGVVRQVFEAGM